MSTLIVYESMYGNTRQLAESIAGAIRGARVLPVWSADQAAVSAAAHVIIGAPTHVFGMSRLTTRREARETARRKALTFEAKTDELGVREWLAQMDLTGKLVAAFDTRAAKLMPGAGRQIQRAAVRAGGRALVRAECFLLTRRNTLRPGELDHAAAWGRMLTSERRVNNVGP
jgi:hypothetical protein